VVTRRFTLPPSRDAAHPRRTLPLKQWKRSPVDDEAVPRWDAYAGARDEMLARTHTPIAPWRIVSADDKRVARLEVIKDLLTHVDYQKKEKRLVVPNPDIVALFDATFLTSGRLAS
jgi:hypothetical protein